ncbi:MAG: PaaI family thioesterase [Burkholderiales bacterium]|nr:PaaI family thioesterase [Burkholderiales bacterium]
MAETDPASAAHEFFGVHVPFLAWLDIRGLEWRPGEARIELVLRPELHNSLSAAHGGVVCTVLDVAMAAAARSDDPEARVITVDMSVQFMRPGIGTLLAVGRTTTVTRSFAFCEAEIRDPAGQLVARGSGVFKRVKPGRGDGDG